MTVRIVTDSACDLPQSVADELGIEIVPLTIRFGDDEFVDRVDLTTAEFWAKAAQHRRRCPRPQRRRPAQFEEAYRQACGRRCDRRRRRVAVGRAVGHDAERRARGALGGRRDPGHASSTAAACTLGLGTIAVACAAPRRRRRRRSTRSPRSPPTSPRGPRVLGALDTLENLKKGGRIGGAKAMLASALAIKPIIEVVDGKVEQGGKQRTRVEGARVPRRQGAPSTRVGSTNLAVLHADCSDVDEFVDDAAPATTTARSSSATSVRSSAPTPGAARSASPSSRSSCAHRRRSRRRDGSIANAQHPTVGTTSVHGGHVHSPHHALGAASRLAVELLAQRYRLERRLAQGGMAEVWLATDIALDRKVAVKLLQADLATDPVVAERFRREAIAVARLSHPNIVAVHDVFEHDGRQAVVMQLVDGKSLRQLLDEQKRLGPELTIHIGSCVAERARRGPPRRASCTATSSPATSSSRPTGACC